MRTFRSLLSRSILRTAGYFAVVGGLLFLGSTTGWAISSAGGLAQETWPVPTWQSFATVFGISGFIGALAAAIRRRYMAFKRCFDLVAASVGLVVMAPLLAILILLIRATSRGPALFTQERVGKDGRIFHMYKLRTMVADAEKETGAVWAKENDPRVTPVGRWLRKTHLDEIPQLMNVLQGEMNLIGPRPERPELVAQLSQEIVDYPKRLAVAPGITGLAQVWSKYDETMEDVRRKVKYDLLYIRQMCLTADLSILFRTVYVVATGQGAR